MSNRRNPGEGTYRRTYTARARTPAGVSRAVRVFLPVGESKAPTKAAQVRALRASLRAGESLDDATIRESWQGRAVASGGRRLAVYAPTRQEAADKLADAVKRAESGVTAHAARLTVGAYLSEWLAGLDVRPRTWEAYESHVRVHLVPSLSRVRLSKLAAAQIDAMLKAKVDAGLKPATANRIRATLRLAVGAAVKHGLLNENVVKRTAPRREAGQPPRPLTADQAAAFLTATASDRLHALWALAVGTGVRQGEALGLTWTDVDLDGATASIRHTLQPKRGGSRRSKRDVPESLHSAKLAPPKSKRAHRTVNLPAFALAALRRHKAAQAAERLAYSGSWPDGDFVFTKPDGWPLDGPWVTKRLQRALADAGLPRQRFHDLRHAAASVALEQGVSLREVMELLGHSSITLTANTYGHIRDKAMRNVADKLDQALGGGV